MKNQITLNGRNEGGESWASADSARKTPGEAAMRTMPSGYESCGIDQFAQGVGGDTDPSGGVSSASLAAGYRKKPMVSPQDWEAVYQAEEDQRPVDVDGFAARNNYFDRM